MLERNNLVSNPYGLAYDGRATQHMSGLRIACLTTTATHHGHVSSVLNNHADRDAQKEGGVPMFRGKCNVQDPKPSKYGKPLAKSQLVEQGRLSTEGHVQGRSHTGRL